MSWPSPQDYNEAIQTPAASFDDPELRAAQPEVDHLGLPRPMTGHFASVYRMHCQRRDVALRCFLHHVPDQHHRYAEISKFIAADDLAYTVGFDYLEKGIRVRGQWYPVLKMEWVAGIPLNQYIEENIRHPQRLCLLAEKFQQMLEALRAAGIAHGDLQHGNILVINDELRLVDYDGMYVPALEGLPSNELGHRNYQHPGRTKDHFGPYLDNFPGWVILNSLKSLAAAPALWDQLDAGDERLLLSSSDFSAPGRSRNFVALRTQPDTKIVEATNELRALLLVPVQEVPAPGTQLDLSALPEMEQPDWITGWQDTNNVNGDDRQADKWARSQVESETPDQEQERLPSPSAAVALHADLKTKFNTSCAILLALFIPTLAIPITAPFVALAIGLYLRRKYRLYKIWSWLISCCKPQKRTVSIQQKSLDSSSFIVDIFDPKGPALRLETAWNPHFRQANFHSTCLFYQHPSLDQIAVKLPDGEVIWATEALEYLSMRDFTDRQVLRTKLHKRVAANFVLDTVLSSLGVFIMAPLAICTGFGLAALFSIGTLIGFCGIGIAIAMTLIWLRNMRSYRRWSWLLKHARPETLNVTMREYGAGEFKNFSVSMHEHGKNVPLAVVTGHRNRRRDFNWPCIVYADPACTEVVIELPAGELLLCRRKRQ